MRSRPATAQSEDGVNETDGIDSIDGMDDEEQKDAKQPRLKHADQPQKIKKKGEERNSSPQTSPIPPRRTKSWLDRSGHGQGHGHGQTVTKVRRTQRQRERQHQQGKKAARDGDDTNNSKGDTDKGIGGWVKRRTGGSASVSGLLSHHSRAGISTMAVVAKSLMRRMKRRKKRGVGNPKDGDDTSKKEHLASGEADDKHKDQGVEHLNTKRPYTKRRTKRKPSGEAEKGPLVGRRVRVVHRRNEASSQANSSLSTPTNNEENKSGSGGGGGSLSLNDHGSDSDSEDSSSSSSSSSSGSYESESTHLTIPSVIMIPTDFQFSSPGSSTAPRKMSQLPQPTTTSPPTLTDYKEDDKASEEDLQRPRGMSVPSDGKRQNTASASGTTRKRDSRIGGAVDPSHPDGSHNRCTLENETNLDGKGQTVERPPPLVSLDDDSTHDEGKNKNHGSYVKTLSSTTSPSPIPPVVSTASEPSSMEVAMPSEEAATSFSKNRSIPASPSHDHDGIKNSDIDNGTSRSPKVSAAANPPRRTQDAEEGTERMPDESLQGEYFEYRQPLNGSNSNKEKEIINNTGKDMTLSRSFLGHKKRREPRIRSRIRPGRTGSSYSNASGYATSSFGDDTMMDSTHFSGYESFHDSDHDEFKEEKNCHSKISKRDQRPGSEREKSGHDRSLDSGVSYQDDLVAVPVPVRYVSIVTGPNIDADDSKPHETTERLEDGLPNISAAKRAARDRSRNLGSKETSDIDFEIASQESFIDPHLEREAHQSEDCPRDHKGTHERGIQKNQQSKNTSSNESLDEEGDDDVDSGSFYIDLEDLSDTKNKQKNISTNVVQKMTRQEDRVDKPNEDSTIQPFLHNTEGEDEVVGHGESQSTRPHCAARDVEDARETKSLRLERRGSLKDTLAHLKARKDARRKTMEYIDSQHERMTTLRRSESPEPSPANNGPHSVEDSELAPTDSATAAETKPTSNSITNINSNNSSDSKDKKKDLEVGEILAAIKARKNARDNIQLSDGLSGEAHKSSALSSPPRGIMQKTSTETIENHHSSEASQRVDATEPVPPSGSPAPEDYLGTKQKQRSSHHDRTRRPCLSRRDERYRPPPGAVDKSLSFTSRRTAGGEDGGARKRPQKLRSFVSTRSERQPMFSRTEHGNLDNTADVPLHQSLHTSLRRKRGDRSKNRKEAKKNDELEQRSWHNIRDRIWKDRKGGSDPKKSTGDKASPQQSGRRVDRLSDSGAMTSLISPISVASSSASRHKSRRKRSQATGSSWKSPISSSSARSKNTTKVSDGNGRHGRDQNVHGGNSSSGDTMG